MAFLRKITMHKKSPEYTRFQWVMKGVTLYLAAIGMDLSGMQIYSREISVFSLKLTPAMGYDIFYVYYCGVHGLCMALALWKLFEIYWWGKDRVSEL